AGLRFARGDLSVEAFAFFTDYDNLVGTCTASTGGGCAIGTQFDGGAVQSKGLELTAAWDLSARLSLPFAAPVSVVYTLTDAEFRSSFVSGYEPWGTVLSGFELPYLPKDQLTLNAGAHGDRWKIDAAINTVSATRSVAGTGAIPASQRIDARTLVDVSAQFDLTPGVGLFLQGQNLTDEVYNVAFSPAGARPGAPRMVMGGLRVRF
ncbi:MAG: TonB-dependent receptor, partial [Reyranella sp.]|nr:TonB-dependent receptor [Reyranella sp.]